MRVSDLCVLVAMQILYYCIIGFAFGQEFTELEHASKYIERIVDDNLFRSSLGSTSLYLDDCTLRVTFETPRDCGQAIALGFADTILSYSTVIDFSELDPKPIGPLRQSKNFPGWLLALPLGPELNNAAAEISVQTQYEFQNQSATPEDRALKRSGFVEHVLSSHGLNSRNVIKTCSNSRIIENLLAYETLIHVRPEASDDFVSALDDFKGKFCDGGAR